MNTLCLLTLLTTGYSEPQQDDTPQPVSSAGETDDWEQRYQRLLKDRPDVRRKVESGGATKQQVIDWLKNGGDKKTTSGGKRKYSRGKVVLRAPDAFRIVGEETVFSGPQPGESLPPFQVVGVSGPLAEKDYDPVALADGKPHVLIFQDTDGATLKGLYFLGPVLDRIVQKSKSDLQVSVVLLSDDRSRLNRRSVEFYQKNGASIRFSHTLDGREGPGVYGLNRNVDVTVLVAKEGKVVRNFVFPSPVFEANPFVLGGVAEVIGEDRETIAEWFRE